MKEVGTFHLEIDRFLRAPREKVFAAFTDASLLKAWHCPRGMTVAEASADAKAGGAYRVVMAGRDGSRFAVGGVYQAIDPPEFIAYTWCSEGGSTGNVTTLIEVRLTAKDGGTLLQMRHTGFPNAQARDSHRNGWQSCFNRLSDLVDPEGSVGTVAVFGNPRSTYCRTVRMGLAEKGVKYRLDPFRPHTPEQLAVHPFGLVPAFRDGEVELYETRAILNYIDEAFEGPSLVSSAGVTARARSEQWISVINCYCYDAMVRRYVLQYFFPKDGQPDRAIISAAVPEIEKQLALFDKAYGASDYLTGSSMVMADLFLAPLIYYLGQFPEGQELIQKYSAVRHGHEVMKTRPSFAATLPN